jgi:hypothetical protein
MSDEHDLSRLHHAMIRGLLIRGACPTNSELAQQLEVAAPKLEELLHALSDIHGVVLHPHICEPWIIHPFSLTPTIHWIEAPHASWWAPCIWCAFGVATLAGGKVQIHTSYGGEGECFAIPVVDGHPAGFDDLYAHFAIPPARAWDNVHQHCSMVLPFRSAEEIREWCNRHGLPRGQVVPLHQVARLARAWYGSHADQNWRKWTVAEAQAIFHNAGLVSDFWNLGAKLGKF